MACKIPIMPPAYAPVVRESPITPRENLMRAFNHQKPMWMPNLYADSQICAAKSSRDMAPTKAAAGVDWFGTNYIFSPEVGINMPAGGVFDDPTTGGSFPVPEGWSLQGGVNGTWTFSDGSDTFRLTTIDFWRQLGKAGQNQYASSGYDRAAFISIGFRSAFASMIGLQADQLGEETVGDALWYTASQETTAYRFGAQNGTILIFEAAPGASADAVEAILPLLKVE